jgi:hypothetical protein
MIPAFYLVWILFSLGLHWGSQWIPSPLTDLASYLFILVALFFLSSLTSLYRRWIEPQLRQRQTYRIGGFLAGLLLFAVVYALVHMGLRSNLISALHSANLLFMACLLGHWLVIALKRPAELIPLCLVMSLVDLYSVFKGPTKTLTGSLSSYYGSSQSGSPPIIDYLLVKFPMPGQAGLLPIFGVSDWVIIALLSAAAAKFDMRDNLFGERALPFVSVAVVGLLMSITLAREAGLYLPALPLIALSFLTLMVFRHPQILRLTGNELRPMGLFLALAAGVMILI